MKTSNGDSEAASNKRRKVRYEDLVTRFPSVFTQPLRPLKIGIASDLARVLEEAFDVQGLPKLLAMHTGKSAYLEQVAKGAQRFDMNGHPDGEVTPEAQRIAQERLNKSQAEREAKAQRALLLKRIEASGMHHIAYANVHGLSPESVNSDFAKAKHERAVRRAARASLVDKFKASGLTVEDYAARHRMPPNKLVLAIAKVEALQLADATQSPPGESPGKLRRRALRREALLARGKVQE